jgi:hypothetical protein
VVGVLASTVEPSVGTGALVRRDSLFNAMIILGDMAGDEGK